MMKPNAIFLFFALLCSCQTPEKAELQAALDSADQNRHELESVLAHYAADDDCRKLAAAEFLIRNMQYHYSQTSPELDRYYEQMDSISQLTPTRWNISREQDSLFSLLDYPFDQPQTKVYDTKVVKAEPLIRHIDQAFKLYDSALWCRNVDFETFCEYLLPYRVANELLDLNWMTFYQQKVVSRTFNAFFYCKTARDSLYTILNRMSTDYKINIEYKNRYPYGYAPQQLYSLRRGTCQDYNILSCFMFRSVGIPMALDYIPLWGNRSMGHDCAALFVNPAVIDTSSVLDYSFSAAPQPLGYYLSGNPNIPTKVYRTTFSRQRESLAVIHENEAIPSEFESIFIKDVSAGYGLIHNVTIKLADAEQAHRFYYLCSFDNHDWVPVAWAQRKRDKVTFANMGGGVVYLPCKYKQGKMQPVSDPFILHRNGRTEFLHADQLHCQSLKLYRKFSVNQNIDKWSHLFAGARIEVSDNALFHNPVILYRFSDSIAVNYQHIILKRPFSCRYLRFVADKDKNGGEVADFIVLDKEGKSLSGTPIGSEEWDSRYPLPAAFDDDILTYAKSKNDSNAWLGFDFGRCQEISEIRILPHNDDNFIRKGERYQLQCWSEGQWWIIDDQFGDDRQYVLFNLCPCDALFRLRNLSRGKEERIFTYENGKQVWW